MVAPGGAYAIRPYTGTIIRAIGPPRGTVIRARGARPVERMLLRPYTGTRTNKPPGRGPQRINDSRRRLRTPAKLVGYPKGCPAFFACTNLPLWSAITIRSYRYIPFNIFFESTEKRTIFVANFHVRCR